MYVIVPIHKIDLILLLSKGFEDLAIRIFPRSASESSVGDMMPKPSLGSKKFATTGSLVDTKSAPKEKEKKVRFGSAVRVILIPTVAEYRQVGLGDLMWWDDGHLKEFKLSAITELKLHMLQHPTMDSKAAIKDLYQPSERDKESPSPTKMENMTTPCAEKTLQSRSNSGRISAEKLANLDGLLFKSRAKDVKFEKSIFKPSESTPLTTGNSGPCKESTALISRPLGVMGLMVPV